jgi:hypothetical protein
MAIPPPLAQVFSLNHNFGTSFKKYAFEHLVDANMVLALFHDAFFINSCFYVASVR